MLSIVLITFLAGCTLNNDALTTPSPSHMQSDDSIPNITTIKSIASSDEIGLEWEFMGQMEIDGFFIYRSMPNESDFGYIATIDDKFATHFLDRNLEPETTYRYMVRPYIGDRIAAPKGFTVVTTQNSLEPVSFAIVFKNLDGKNKLLWRPHTDLRVGSYLIERGVGDSWSRLAELKGRLNAEYIDKNVDDEYQYRITAISKITKASEPLIFKEENLVLKKSKKVQIPTILGAKLVENRVAISWDEIVGAKSYLLTKESLDGKEEIELKENIYYDSKIKQGFHYAYKVQAIMEDESKTAFSKEYRVIIN